MTAEIFIPLCICLNKVFPTFTLPFAVLSISLFLLFQQALISNYLSGWDIHKEYYYQSLVVANGFWDPSIPVSLNAMASIVILGPIYSIMLKMDAVWVLKIIYPLLFSLVPLILFEVYRGFIGPRRAFLATFLFISMVVFFTEMISLARQQIAEIFFGLLILLVMEKGLTRTLKSALIVIFSTSLIISHYGLSYISLGVFAIGLLLVFLTKARFSRKDPENPGAILPIEGNGSLQVSRPTKFEPALLNGYLMLYFVCFTALWYLFVSSGVTLGTLSFIANSIRSQLSDIFFLSSREPLVTTALGLDWSQVSILGKLFRIIQYAVEIFILIELLVLLFRSKKSKLNFEYVCIALAVGSILFACIAVPVFSSFLNLTRFFHIGLIVLAPICIMGIAASWRFVGRRLEKAFWRRQPAFPGVAVIYIICLVLLIPYYLFNTGFIFEISKSEYSSGQMPISMGLSDYRLDFAEYRPSEAMAAQWLSQRGDISGIAYGDEYGKLILEDYMFTRAESISGHLDQIEIGPSYIFLRPWNINKEEVFMFSGEEVGGTYEHVKIEDVPQLAGIRDSKSLAYNNGGSQILAP